MSRSVKYARGVTLTPEERRMAGYAPGYRAQERTPSGPCKAHACTVTLPDDSRSEVTYARINARLHRFDYRALSERVWFDGPLVGGAPEVECKSQELAGRAFRQAQKAEQQEMRRAQPPSHLLPTRDKEPQMRAKAATLCAGLYAVCLRYPSGQLAPLSPACERPTGALALLRRMRAHDSRGLVIGICCRWARRWQTPRFLADGTDDTDEPERVNTTGKDTEADLPEEELEEDEEEVEDDA